MAVVPQSPPGQLLGPGSGFQQRPKVGTTLDLFLNLRSAWGASLEGSHTENERKVPCNKDSESNQPGLYPGSSIDLVI